MQKERVLENVVRYLSQKEPSKFIKGESEVPCSGGKLSNFDIMNVIDAALDGWMTDGKWSEKFRRALTSYTGFRHAILCNSGSSANLLALQGVKELYKVKDHAAVVTSALAFSTTIAPIIQSNLKPCFVDIDQFSLNPSPERIEKAIKQEKAAGVILAHTLGYPYDVKAIDKICKENGCFFVQDMCDALGAKTNDGEQLSEFGDVATLSFFPAHQLTTGEGGAVLMNNGRLMNIIRSFANWGRDCWCKPGEANTCNKRFGWEFDDLPKGYDHKYIYSRVGYNLKMTELQAALGVSQMNRIREIVNIRRAHYIHLKAGFSDILDFANAFTYFRNPILSSPFGFPLMAKPWITTRDKIVGFLEDRKIRTRPIFSGNITRQPMMKKSKFDIVGGLYYCDQVMENAFWFGVHPELDIYQLDYVIESFAEFIGGL